MAVRSKHTVWIKLAILFNDDITEKFDIDLMDNSCSRRNCSIIIKGFLSPLEKFVALIVADKFLGHIGLQSSVTAIKVHLNTVVNN